MAAETASIVVELFPASHGDAALVRCLGPGGTTNILVDGGLQSTYDTFTKTRLAELSQDGEDLALLVVSHIDDDHIGGALALIADNGSASAPKLIGIRDVWHNSYKHLPLSGRPPTPEEVAKVHSQARHGTTSPSGNISARQGSCLAALLKRFAYPWNVAFSGGPVVSVEGAPCSIALSPSVTVTVLSPLPAHLAALSRLWRRELLRLGVDHNAVDSPDFEEAFESFLLSTLDLTDDSQLEERISSRMLTDPLPASAFREDRSVTNASSIALLITCHDLSVAMLGDALPSVIESQLPAGGTAAWDAMKVSHHGSIRNTSPSLLSSIVCKNYLISTDALRHGHPDLATMLWIATSQTQPIFHFNYDVAVARQLDEATLKARYGHSVRVARVGESIRLLLSASAAS